MVLKILLSKVFPIQPTWPEEMELILFQVRFPRVLGAILVGAALSAAGAAYQIIFRNPLVSPSVLGVSAGASFGAALGLLLHYQWSVVQGMAFIFGLLAVFMALGISRIQSEKPVIILVLGGMVVTALFQAFLSIVKYVADPNDSLPAITFWLMGSLSGMDATSLFFTIVPVFVGSILLYLLGWQINVLSVSEEEARLLGIKTNRIRMSVIVIATLMTATVVSVSGVIGWVGLLIPHMARFLTGSNFRKLLPVSMLLGGGFLLVMDNLARLLLAVEIPLGILTAIIGAPFFILLLRKAKGV